MDLIERGMPAVYASHWGGQKRLLGPFEPQRYLQRRGCAMETVASTWLRHVDGKAVLRPSSASSGGPV